MTTIQFLKEAIEVATENLEKLYELAGGLKHQGETGSLREYFVSQLILPFIPTHFGYWLWNRC